MRIFGFCGLFLLLSLETSAEELRFRGPLTIPGSSGLVTVHAGDVDGNNKLDLIASSGGPDILVYFQDDEDRLAWTPVSVSVGVSCLFARAGDFDNDGFDDLAVADRHSTTFVVRSRGDRTFDPPEPLLESWGARWIAIGDWDDDSHLDLASSNLWTHSMTVYVGNGDFDFFLSNSTELPQEHRPHTLEALDFNDDGELDLVLGIGAPGILLHQGLGDGTFVTAPSPLETLGCVEYLAVGDFNNDGLGDIASSCVSDRTAYAGISEGEGGYTRIFSDAFAAGTESSAIGDLNGDGNDDLVLGSKGSTFLKVYLGKGDATFEEPILFGNTSGGPSFLITEDLDQDGHLDIISAGQNLTVFFGREGDFGRKGEPPFESNRSISGYGSARARAVADMNNDGLPELLYADSTSNTVRIFLNPGESSPSEPDLHVTTTARYSILDAADLNGDGIADLIGGSTALDLIRTSILDADGNVSQEQSMPCGSQLRTMATGFFDEPKDGAVGEAPTLDLIALCASGATSNLLLFFGRGDGTFDDSPAVRTIAGARQIDSADADGDGLSDVAVGGSTTLTVHYGVEGGHLSPLGDVIQGPSGSFEAIELADLDGDGHGDLLTGGKNGPVVRFYRGRGAREFEEPIELNVGVTPTKLQAIDLDGDGRLDFAVGGRVANIWLIYNLGEEGFSEPQVVHTGLMLSTFQVLDVNGDQANDIVAFGDASTSIILSKTDGLLPETPGFKRGDVDGSGAVDITDPLLNLTFQFVGAMPPCLDALDVDDSGLIDITDPLWNLRFQFLGTVTIPAPGAESCGPDPTDMEDDLRCEAYPQTSCVNP